MRRPEQATFNLSEDFRFHDEAPGLLESSYSQQIQKSSTEINTSGIPRELFTVEDGSVSSNQKCIALTCYKFGLKFIDQRLPFNYSISL